jgi:aminocarboxymuconate-semialdehyde decarboxylase
MIIDTQHHYRLEGTDNNNRGIITKSIEEHVEAMDLYGIDKAILTNQLGTPSFENEGVYSALNDELVSVTRNYSDRFVICPSIPIHDSKSAIRELERVVSKYEVRSVCLRPYMWRIDHEYLHSFYEKVSDLDLLVITHPVFSGTPLEEIYGSVDVGVGIGYMLSTTVALSRLIFSGLLESLDLKFIFPHLGGAIPFLIGRMDCMWEVSDQRLPKPPSKYMKKIYFDTVCYDPDALKLTIKFAGTDKIVLGTDLGCPTHKNSDGQDLGLVKPGEMIKLIRNLELSEAEKTNILGGNIERLLGLKAKVTAR